MSQVRTIGSEKLKVYKDNLSQKISYTAASTLAWGCWGQTYCNLFYLILRLYSWLYPLLELKLQKKDLCLCVCLSVCIANY